MTIFTLRETMRKMQEAFGISKLGTKHTTPSTEKEVAALRTMLKEGRIQEWVGADRDDNRQVQEVRDLFAEGSYYVMKPSAFTKFRKSDHRAENVGRTNEDGFASDEEDESDDEGDEFYEPDMADLQLDEDEVANYDGMQNIFGTGAEVD